MAKRLTCDLTTTAKGNRMMTLRGSEFGMCMHRHLACLKGFTEAPPEPGLQKIFDAGNRSEPAQKALLASLGVDWIEDASGKDNQIQLRLYDFRPEEQRVVQLLISPDGLMRIENEARFGLGGHPALDVRDKASTPTVFGYECKALGEVNFKKACSHGVDFNETYAWQCSAMTHAYREREKDPTIGLAFMAQLREKADPAKPNYIGLGEQYVLWLYDEPPFTKEQVMARCWAVFDAHDAGLWPKCDSVYPCRYPHSASPTSPGIVGEVLRQLADSTMEHDKLQREAEHMLCGMVLPMTVGGFIVTRRASQIIEVRR